MQNPAFQQVAVVMTVTAQKERDMKTEKADVDRELVHHFEKLVRLVGSIDGAPAERVLDVIEVVLQGAKRWDLVGELEKRALARKGLQGVDVTNSLSFLDDTERDLGAALDECGAICAEHVDDLPLLLSALTGAWRNLRFARRELDPTAWARYRSTNEPIPDNEIDTSDNEPSVQSTPMAENGSIRHEGAAE